jgi:hypothetical protein
VHPISHARSASGVTSPGVRKGGLLADNCSERAVLEGADMVIYALQLESLESESVEVCSTVGICATVDVCATGDVCGCELSREEILDIGEGARGIITGEESSSGEVCNSSGEVCISGVAALRLERLLVTKGDDGTGTR